MKNNKDIFNSMNPYAERGRGSKKLGAFDKPYRSVSRTTKPLESIDVNDEDEPDKPFLGEVVRMGSPVAQRSPYLDVRSRNVNQAVAGSQDRNYLEAQHLLHAHQ